MSYYSVTLTFQTPSLVTFLGREVFRLVCTVSDPIGMPAEIFGHEQTLVDPITGQQQDEFSFVCSPYELSIFPANEPDPTQSPQFFRKSEVDILLPTLLMYADTQQAITDQVTRLLDLLHALDNLQVVSTVTLTSGTVDSSSSSASSSSSSETL